MQGVPGLDKCHALALWFDVAFSDRFCSEQPVVLSTSPAEPQTHWKQTMLVLRWARCLRRSPEADITSCQCRKVPEVLFLWTID
jgi:hypothetical protein